MLKWIDLIAAPCTVCERAPGRFKLDFPSATTILCESCWEIAQEPD